jgi:uncharacterized protein (TIGR02246 family)
MTTTDNALIERLTAVEDRLAIAELLARYCFGIDNRDLAAVGDLFTTHARFATLDGSRNSIGREAIVAGFEKRYDVLGATNHIVHHHTIRFESPTRARGEVSSHAEVWRNEQAQLAALRYLDTYEKGNGVWRFAERIQTFMYYVPVERYAEVLGQLERNLSGAQPKAADYPEQLPTYVERRKLKNA